MILQIKDAAFPWASAHFDLPNYLFGSGREWPRSATKERRTKSLRTKRELATGLSSTFLEGFCLTISYQITDGDYYDICMTRNGNLIQRIRGSERGGGHVEKKTLKCLFGLKGSLCFISIGLYWISSDSHERQPGGVINILRESDQLIYLILCVEASLLSLLCRDK